MATFYRTPWKGSEPSNYAAVNPHKFGRNRRGGKPAFGGGSRSRSDRPHGNRPYRGGGRGRGGRGRNNPGENIDINKFINKAVPQAEAAPYIPKHSFADFALNERIQRNLADKGYAMPTPIQDQAIPAALTGRDIVGLANTGTGKTGAFLIPLINRAILNPQMRVLVMAPTRELAVQIKDEFRGFARTLSLEAVLCVGGAGIVPQMMTLRRRPAFVIGTPGRLKDLMERGALDLGSFDTVVLDEADRMLDMGFIDDMRFIIGKMPTPRHTLFFSATMSREIERLIGDFLNDPVTVSVKTRDTAATIDQDVVHIQPGQNKLEVLVHLLQNPEMSKVLVFGRTKYGVERLAKDLLRQGVAAEAIHGDKTHGRRLKALEAFKRDQVQVLVATDVAARGLDISGVSHVINFDLPQSYEDYVHRIGRTGRAGKVGKALTFIQ
ncbi:MAG TPA: DEAD/DEAH box helicase [Candidatus Paceibacterota bacterium]|nr:DEAD/DEAH box helicase [Candidatus Paceibacterota bacterium]